MRQVDLRGQFVRQSVGKEILNRNCGERGVGDKGVARGVSEARRFDLDMEIVDIERIRPDLEARQDVEDHQSDDALAVRRAFVDCSAAKLGRDRLDIFALRASEIVRRMQSAEAAEIGDHVLGDRPTIEGVRTFAANGFQGLREFGLTLDGADAGRLAVAQEG